MATTLVIDASQPQHTPAGHVLRKMYYSGFLNTALEREEYFGYPHNGGKHSLVLKMPLPDVQAFLSLVKETFKKEQDGVEQFIATVLSKVPRSTAVH